MLKQLLRVGAIIPLAALVLGASSPAPANAAADGSSPSSAIDLGSGRNTVVIGVLKAGESRWYVASQGGPFPDTQRMVATAQFNPAIAPSGKTYLQGQSTLEPGLLVVYVDLQGSKSQIGGGGEENKDWPGFTRIGFLTVTGNTGTDRVYHLSRPNLRQAYYYFMQNNTKEDVTFGLSMNHSFCFTCTAEHAQGPHTFGMLPPPWALAS